MTRAELALAAVRARAPIPRTPGAAPTARSRRCRRRPRRHGLHTADGAARVGPTRICTSRVSAATSTRGFASAASVGSPRSCSPRAASTGSGLADEIGFRVPTEMMLPEVGQGFIALQTRVDGGGAASPR